jgi:hypothetical protein
MEFASPPRKLLFQENFSPKFEITYGIILLELESR